MTQTRPTDKIFEALRSLGPGWHSRSELARKIGKTRITGYDAALLDLLVADGAVEAEKGQMRGPIGYFWQYRVKE